MQVRHRDTGVEQTIEKKDWKVLEESGHSANFEVISEEDYEPSELSLPAKAVKGKGEQPKAE